MKPVSLRWLVPALSAAILSVVVTLFGAIAYRAVRTSTVEVAAGRLTTAAQVLTQPTAQPAAWIRELQTAARYPAVREILLSNGASVSDSARAVISRLTPDTGQGLLTDVRMANGTVLYSLANAAAESLMGAPTRTEAIPGAPRDSADLEPRLLASPLRRTRSYPDSVVQSELYVGHNQMLFERAVPLRSNGRLVGHLVQVRRIGSAPNALRQLAGLIGKDAALVVGNRDGSLWTDLTKPVTHPPASTTVQTYERDGRRWISATRPAATGPWILAAELPEDVVLAPVHALRWRLFMIGAVIVTLAVLITERVSRRLTLPLQGLTKAAEQIAAGNRRTPIVPLKRVDEIGRLSRAFAAMADSVRFSHDTLEHEIGERTHDLQATLTRLQQAQEELVRQERLATLGQLSGSIAHELRNPLGVMTNALYYLDTVLSDAEPKVRDHLAKLRTQVRLSESIITGLLNVTRTGAPHPSSVTVDQIVNEQLARMNVPDTVQVACDFEHGLPELTVDPVQLGQILMNLFTNAIQAMEGSEGVLSVRARAAGDRVRIEVADTGPGITREDRERVFEPLFTTKARGIGLGLSVARSLAQANNGELTVAADVGRGASLTVDLPAVTRVDAVPNEQARKAAAV
ncbi:MAG: sensor histidine kinase [Gemmatimonadaceae bacterium]